MSSAINWALKVLRSGDYIFSLIPVLKEHKVVFYFRKMAPILKFVSRTLQEYFHELVFDNNKSETSGMLPPVNPDVNI